MLYNFNYKKFFKYFFICLCFILLCNSCNAKAWSNLNDQYIVNYTNEGGSDLSNFLIKGDTNYLDSYLTQNNLATGFSDYYERVKTKVATDLGYSSFEAFTQDYYYITDVWLTPSSYSTRYVQLSFFYCLRSSENAYRFGLSLSTTIRSSSNPTINANQTYYTQFGAIYRTSAYYFYQQFEHLGNTTFDSVQSGAFAQQIMTCNSSSSYCDVVDYDNTDKILTIQFRNSDGRFLHFVDTNKPQLDYYFAKVNVMLVSNDYVFQKAKINNSSSTYNLIDVWAENVLDTFTIYESNVQDLGNNSYGVNTNTVRNIFLDFENNSSSFINCPMNTPFVNNTCFLYARDINDFDIYNTNVSNSVIWFLGNNSTIKLDSSKYYALSFRVYTNYNLDIYTTIYHITGENVDYPFNIQTKYVQDNVLYKDYVIVFQPTHSGVGYLSFFDIVFNTLDNFTSELDNSFNFGAFKTFKISEYSTLPTQTDVENELSNNSLTSISNNSLGSFFSDFRLDDYGLSSIILYPLNFAESFANYSCSPLILPFPHGTNFTLPCVSTFMSENFNVFWELYRLVFNGLITYRILINLYGLIKNIYSPDNDRIEVVDL